MACMPVQPAAAAAACSAVSTVTGLLSARPTFSYGTVTDAPITNNGHTVVVTLPDNMTSTVRLPIYGESA
jgi:hypothetical protein